VTLGRDAATLAGAIVPFVPESPFLSELRPSLGNERNTHRGDRQRVSAHDGHL
jgi:hypothetical protein